MGDVAGSNRGGRRLAVGPAGVRFSLCLLLVVLPGLGGRGWAQSKPTASRAAILEAFVMGSGVTTHYHSGGRNASMTAGGDVLFHAVRRVSPGFELRLTLPLSSGDVAGEKSYLGGGRIGLNLGHLHPYVDGLFGLGRIDFVHPNGNYRHDNSTVYDGGGGLEYEIGGAISVKGEVQWQHWKIGEGKGETFNPGQFNFGLSYRFFPGRTPSR